MKLSLDTSGEARLINAYGPGWIRLNETTYRASLVLARGTLITDWGPRSVEELNEAHFRRIAELEPEMVLLGTGATQRFPDPAVTVPLIERGIGLEVMDTAAAARTYNLLVGDGRAVAAALIVES